MNKNLLLSTVKLARKNLGKTAPNPTVACIIEKNNKIISTGFTSLGGRPHAERNAINKVKNPQDLKDSTLYVSLEPCCHFGKTPPCTDIIIESGIKKVVIASIDNNPLVNSQGIEKLKNNSIQVELVEIDEAYELNRGFFKTQKQQIPFTTLKLGISSNYKIAKENGQRIQITNRNSQNYTHYLRSINDGILIGSNTLKNDNPILNCRLNGLENFSPKRFILSKDIDFDENYQIFQNCDEIATFIITSTKNQKNNLDNFIKKGVKFIFCDEADNNVSLLCALRKIKQENVNSLLIEGGQNLTTSILNQNLVDELILIKNENSIKNGFSAIREDNKNSIHDFISKLTLKKKKKSGQSDIIEIYQK